MLFRNKNEYISRQIYYAMLKRYIINLLWVYLYYGNDLLFQSIDCNESRNKNTIKRN